MHSRWHSTQKKNWKGAAMVALLEVGAAAVERPQQKSPSALAAAAAVLAAK
jgi:hypothetical protein